MNRLDYHYLWLLRKIKEDGIQKEGRNGWTRSIFGYQIRHHMDEGFPLLTTKKMWWKGIRTELEWFLNGDTNIQYLVKRGNNIWVGDAYKRYLNYLDEYHESEQEPDFNNLVDDPVENKLRPLTEEEFIEKIKEDDEFAEEWGDMGPIYGKQWREFTSVNEYGVSSVDQIQKLINDLREKPDSRRLMVNAWNPVQLDDMVLPPCHYGFQVWTRELTLDERINTFLIDSVKDTTVEYIEENDEEELEKKCDEMNIPTRGISLMWNQRSVDTPLGLPFNIASYGLLLEMIADEVMMKPLELIGNLGDVHIYENQLEGVEEQLSREDKIHELPTVHVRDGIWSRGDGDIILQNYESEDSIYFPLSN